MRVILSAHYLAHSKDMLKELNFMCVRDRITYFNGCMVYRAVNNLTPSYLSSKFVPVRLRHDHQTRSSINGNIETCKFITNYGKSTFKYKGATTWNVICPTIRNTKWLNNFKKSFKAEFIWALVSHNVMCLLPCSCVYIVFLIMLIVIAYCF